MTRLNTEERNMIIIQGLDIFAFSLAGIFVTVFLFINSDLKTTLLYSIIMNISFLSFYLSSGWIMKRIPSSTLIKASIATGVIYYFSLFILKEKAIQFLIPLAIFDGFGGGIYWAGYNLNQYAFTNSNSRVKYFGWTYTVLNIFRAIAPVIGGIVITLTGNQILFGIRAGYSVLFLIVGIIFLAMLIFISKLPKHALISFSISHILEHKRSKAWKNVLCQQFFFGLYDVVYGTMLGVLLFLIVEKELVLGLVQTLSFVVSAIGSMIAVKILYKYGKGYWIGVLGQSVGIIMFAINQNFIGVIFYIISGIVTPLLYTWLSTVSLQSMDTDTRLISEKYHLIVEQIFVLLSARILSYLLIFIFIQFGDEIQFAKMFLFILPVFPIVIGLLLTKYDNDQKYSKTN